MFRTFKYRIYGNKQTITNADNWLSRCRDLYNTAIIQRKMAYKSSRRYLSFYDQQAELPLLRRYFPEYSEVNAQVLGNVIRRVDSAFRYFKNNLKKGNRCGLPRLKSQNRYNSFTLIQNGWRLEGNQLRIIKLGIFKIKLSRPIIGKIKLILLTQQKLAVTVGR